MRVNSSMFNIRGSSDFAREQTENKINLERGQEMRESLRDHNDSHPKGFPTGMTCFTGRESLWGHFFIL